MKRNPYPFRRGAVLLYSFYMMIIMMAIASLAVDYGRREMIKTEMQRCADATAHAALERYIQNNDTFDSKTYLKTTFAGYEPIDANSGVSPTVSVNFGTWNTTTKTFTNNGSPSTGNLQAVKIVVSRTSANGNPIPMTFPLPSSGKSWIRSSYDLYVSSIAVLNPPVTVTETVSALYNPWLSGMSVGSSLSYGASTPGNNLTDSVTSDSSNNGPPLSMDVTAGTVITFTNVTGGTAHDPQMGNTDTADGESSPWTHMQDSPDGNHNGEQNNIQTLTSPLDSLVGVFLGGANGDAPSAANAPSVSNDYMTQNDSTIQVQEPFYIGDGTPYSNPNVTAQFVVPKGATRLFLGTMDGYQWNNNGGSYSVTITQQPTISLVQ